jgi:S-layer family protein
MSNVAGLVNGWKRVLPVVFLLLGVSLSAGIAFAGLPAGRGTGALPQSKGGQVAPVRSKMEMPVRAQDLRNPRNPAAVLYDQSNGLNETTISSQDFEAAYNNYDDQAADDFIVPAGETWLVNGVDVAGAYSFDGGPAESVGVYIYADSGSLPGTPVFSQTAIMPASGLDTGNFSLALSPPATLSAGTYWVSVQANQEVGLTGQWFWRARTGTINTFSAWRNPGGGFNRNLCIASWGRRVLECSFGGNAPDQVFRLNGTVVGIPTVTGTPPTSTATSEPGTPTATITGTATIPTATGTPPTATATRTRAVPTPVLTKQVPITPGSQASPTPIPGCGLYWRIVDSPNVDNSGNALYDVAVASATDVWAVGFYIDLGRFRTLTLHWDGSQWNNVPSPNPGSDSEDNLLYGVAAVSPNDVWAVGTHTDNSADTTPLILHWDGSQWNEVPGPVIAGKNTRLEDVEAISADDVWAVGSWTNMSGGAGTLTLHWDGTNWSQVSSPSTGEFSGLNAVSGTSSTDVWAAGTAFTSGGFQALTLHWNGQAWSMVNTPNIFNDSSLNGIEAIAPNDAWAVGYYSNDGFDYFTLTLHWDGTAWSQASSPNGSDVDNTLTSVSAASPSDVWAVGYYFNQDINRNETIILRWNGSAWARVANPNTQTDLNYLQGVAVVWSDDVWAVGSYGNGNTLVERYSDPCAPPTNTPVPTDTPVATSTPTITATATRTNTPMPTPTACTLTFTDVPTSNAFYVHVRCLACKGILGGYSDGSFRPNNDITRGQLSKIVANSAGFNEPVSGQTFEDVPAGSTFYAFIERMAGRGIIGGYPCGGTGEPCGTDNRPYFRPNANATRGQISKIVSNAKGYNDPTGSQIFEDVPPGSAFYDWVQRLAARGIMGGYPCGGAGEPCGSGNRPYFRPNNNATRGQVSKIVANTFFPGCNPPARR